MYHHFKKSWNILIVINLADIKDFLCPHLRTSIWIWNKFTAAIRGFDYKINDSDFPDSTPVLWIKPGLAVQIKIVNSEGNLYKRFWPYMNILASKCMFSTSIWTFLTSKYTFLALPVSWLISPHFRETILTQYILYIRNILPFTGLFFVHFWPQSVRFWPQKCYYLLLLLDSSKII